MTQLIIRVGGAALLAILLAVQAQRVAGPGRRRAFLFGSGAFALIAVSNTLSALGASGVFVYAAAVAALILLALTLFFLLRAYRAGELSTDLSRARSLIADERARYNDETSPKDEQR